MDKETLQVIIGLNIARYREQKGLTQAKLAELVGITTTQIANLENETGKGVSVPVLYNIATVLEVSLDRLCSKEKILVKID